MIDWIQTLVPLIKDWINGEIIFSMCQRLSIIFVIAFLFSKSKAFELLVKNSMRKRDWLVLYAVFFFISTMGSLIADQITIQTFDGSWLDSVIEKREIALFANNAVEDKHSATIQVDSRAIGSVLAGLLGGPLLGGAVGLSAGLTRYLMGGDAAIAGAMGIFSAGFLAGLVYMVVLHIRPSMRFNWKIAFFTACFLELLMKGMVLLTNLPLAKGIALIQVTTVPNTLGNAIGVALFVTILNDYDKTTASSSTNALNMAAFFARVLKRDISQQQKATRIANFIQKNTGIAAVAITDQINLVAFKGMGSDHHHVSDVMATGLIKKALDSKEIIFIDGYKDHFLCKKTKQCPLHSALIAPIIVNDVVEGAILLFESKHRFFPKMNRELGKGLASLLSEQILAARYPELLAQAEDKYLRARVDPHFFANALTTISAITRTNENKARGLLRKLASLMRERINTKDAGNTLAQELTFLEAYIEIEKERFGHKLQISVNADPSLLDMVVPRFALQLLVENAIKHGVSKLLDTGFIEVNAYRSDDNLVKIDVKDNAGQFCEKAANKSAGYGMKLVDDLIKTQFNSNQYGLSTQCKVDEYTIVTITLPYDADNNELMS